MKYVLTYDLADGAYDLAMQHYPAHRGLYRFRLAVNSVCVAGRNMTRMLAPQRIDTAPRKCVLETVAHDNADIHGALDDQYGLDYNLDAPADPYKEFDFAPFEAIRHELVELGVQVHRRLEPGRVAHARTAQHLDAAGRVRGEQHTGLAAHLAACHPRGESGEAGAGCAPA